MQTVVLLSNREIIQFYNMDFICVRLLETSENSCSILFHRLGKPVFKDHTIVKRKIKYKYIIFEL